VFDGGGGVSDRPESERVRRARERVGDAYVDERTTTGRRDYSWAPFERGNLVRLKHGATAPAIVDPVAEELVSGLVERRPDLADFLEALHAWGRAEARCLLLGSWVAEHGIVDEKGEPTASARIIAQFGRLANELRQRLGLDPKSAAELANAQADAAKNVTDLESLRERGRKALKARREIGSGRVSDGDDRLRDGGAR
jgi:hypothetical protein